MRISSAFAVLTVAACAAACSVPVARAPRAEPAIASLKDLGVEGKTTWSNLGADRAFHLNRIWNVGNDLLLEDIHGALVYLDGGTLMARWVYNGLPRPFDSAPDWTATSIVGVCKDRAYVISRRNGLDEIDPARLGVVPSAGVAANDSTLFVPTYKTPSGNKTIQSVNLTDGYLGWGWRTESDVMVNLAKAGLQGGDMIYAATEDGNVIGMPALPASSRDPEPAWMVDLHSGVHRQLTVAGEDVGVVTDDHRLMVLDRITGAHRWTAYPNAGDRAESGAQFSASHAFYRVSGELRAFDRASGQKAWAVRGASAFVAQRGSRTILANGDGLVAVETKSGRVLGRKSMRGWRFPMRATPDATVVAISEQGMVVGVETGW
jgi:hypothetical protein